MQIISSESPPVPRRKARAKGLKPEGRAAWITNYMGHDGRPSVENASPVEIFPMAFLFEQEANSVLGAHFHAVDQFQVFTEGDGMLAADPIKSICVQFVSPFTPYGPIKAFDRGIKYFTLRNGFDPGANEMPESASKLPPRPRKFRQLLSQPVEPLSEEERRSLRDIVAIELIRIQEDGVAAWLYRLPPGRTTVGPNPAAGRGQHWVVVSGALEQHGQTFPPLSCGFLKGSEAAFRATAGPSGLEILALQYPARDDLRDPRSGGAPRTDGGRRNS